MTFWLLQAQHTKIISALDKGADSLSHFVPLALRIMENKSNLSIPNIKKNIHNQHDNILNNILYFCTSKYLDTSVHSIIWNHFAIVTKQSNSYNLEIK